MNTQTISTTTTLKDALNLIASPQHRNDSEPRETRAIANFETGNFDGKSFSFSYKHGRFSGFCADRGVMMSNDTTNEICLRKDVADAEYFAGLWFNEIDNGVTPAVSPARLKKQRASQPLQPAPATADMTTTI